MFSIKHLLGIPPWGYAPPCSPQKPYTITPALLAGSHDDCIQRRDILSLQKGWCSVINSFKNLLSPFTQKALTSVETTYQNISLNVQIELTTRLRGTNFSASCTDSEFLRHKKSAVSKRNDLNYSLPQSPPISGKGEGFFGMPGSLPQGEVVIFQDMPTAAGG